MADSDLYQHLLSAECEHNIIAPNINILHLYGSFSSSVSVSSLQSNTTDTSISPSLSDDEFPKTSMIEGGLQRALVVMSNDNTSPIFESIYDGINGDDYEEYNNANTVSFTSWISEYGVQSEQIMDCKRKKKYIPRKQNKASSVNKRALIYLNTLQNLLPFNPSKLRKRIKSKQINNDSLVIQSAPQIDAIQQVIFLYLLCACVLEFAQYFRKY